MTPSQDAPAYVWESAFKTAKALKMPIRPLYYAYLQSDRWAARRAWIIGLAHGTCQICRKAPATQAHHLTYDRCGNELEADLQAVCKPCHDGQHADKNGLPQLTAGLTRYEKFNEARRRKMLWRSLTAKRIDAAAYQKSMSEQTQTYPTLVTALSRSFPRPNYTGLYVETEDGSEPQ